MSLIKNNVAMVRALGVAVVVAADGSAVTVIVTEVSYFVLSATPLTVMAACAAGRQGKPARKIRVLVFMNGFKAVQG